MHPAVAKTALALLRIGFGLRTTEQAITRPRNTRVASVAFASELSLINDALRRILHTERCSNAQPEGTDRSDRAHPVEALTLESEQAITRDGRDDSITISAG